MSDQPPSDVLGALPRRRPHRRSDKRPSPAQAQSPTPSDGGEASTRPPSPSGPQTTRSRGTRLKQSSRSTAETATVADEPTTAQEPAAPQEPITPREPATAPEPDPLGADTDRPQRLRQPAQPAGVPATPRRRPAQSGGRHVLTTAVHAAAELTEIGLSVSARALRGMVERLPRP